jgi:hypothetical protein
MGDGILESLIVCLNQVDELMVSCCVCSHSRSSLCCGFLGVNVEFEPCSVYNIIFKSGEGPDRCLISLKMERVARDSSRRNL